MFDRSLLPPARLEFVVVADTHYMLPLGDGSGEFASRQVQTARAEIALRLAASLDSEFVLHLGDLVQEYPESERFSEAMDAAVAQLKACGLAPHQVAGNHDGGDKPDRTMPTRPVTAESLREFHERFGRSWYSFDHGECHFVVLNSQVMNTSLPARVEQKRWLEEDLEQNSGRRLFVFLHLPPYLISDDEQALGHYDNISEPDREWLMDLALRYRFEVLMAAHVHCAFYDRVGSTRYFVANSTSFTRPGFCHVFASEPPADHGRDDSAKLGFYLFRVRDDTTDIHFLRTGGATEVLPSSETGRRRLVSRTPAAIHNGALGLTLRHPLGSAVQIPLAWPSAIRQRVRNDYPLLACLELGATTLRAPAADLDDPFQARRLELVRREGVSVVGCAIWSDDPRDAGRLQELLFDREDELDGVEVQLVGSPWPTARQLDAFRGRTVPLTLSTIIPGELLSGKQHPRTRMGFRIEELAELNDRLNASDTRVERVLCRLSGEPSLWRELAELASAAAWTHLGQIDLSLELKTLDDEANALAGAEALFATALIPGARLYVDPLIDLDRTMDVEHGLLDTLCNPRPVFNVLRSLNSIVSAAREHLLYNEGFVAGESEGRGPRFLTLSCGRSTLGLLPGVSPDGQPAALSTLLKSSRRVRVYELAASLVSEMPAPEVEGFLGELRSTGPLLLWCE